MSYYNQKIVQLIYTALSAGPATIAELAEQTGYSKGTINIHLMHIRRDESLSWDITRIGHGNGNGYASVYLTKRGTAPTAAHAETIINGHNSWQGTLENKAVSIRKQLEIAQSLPMTPASKKYLDKAVIHMEMAEDFIKKARL